MRIAILEHVPFENPGCIRPWAEQRGHALNEVLLYAGERLPSVDTFDWLIAIGGPMSVDDEARHPWLAPEKRLLGAAVAGDQLVLGVCLGAQLLAQVLGAVVTPLPHREIGWFPIEPTEEACDSPLFGDFTTPIEVFHWHGETFALPSNALHVARSEACEHQIFTVGDRVVGIQCHPEMTLAGAAALADHCPADLAGGPWTQSRTEVVRDGGRFERAHEWMIRLLSSMEKSWTVSRSA